MKSSVKPETRMASVITYAPNLGEIQILRYKIQKSS